MSGMNDGLRLCLVVKCFMVINLSLHEGITVFYVKNLTVDWKTIEDIRYMYNIIKKT